MNREKTGIRKIKINGKVAVLGILIIICGTAAVFASGIFDGEETVNFQPVNENRMPDEIRSEIIPEYKTLERALACIIDDDVYVIVTRGEKPTSGFKVAVDRITLENKDGKSNLIVYSKFEDPEKKTAVSQILTYPVQVVETDLDKLPDTIELRIQY